MSSLVIFWTSERVGHLARGFALPAGVERGCAVLGDGCGLPDGVALPEDVERGCAALGDGCAVLGDG